MVFVETKRILGVDEDPYSRRETIPDDGVAPVSAKNTALLLAVQRLRERLEGVREPLTLGAGDTVEQRSERVRRA